MLKVMNSQGPYDFQLLVYDIIMIQVLQNNQNGVVSLLAAKKQDDMKAGFWKSMEKIPTAK